MRDPEHIFLVTERLGAGPCCHPPGRGSRDCCGKSDPNGPLALPYSLSRSSSQKDADHPLPVAPTMVCNIRENLVISLIIPELVAGCCSILAAAKHVVGADFYGDCSVDTP